MSVGADEFKRTKRKPIKSNQVKNSRKKVSSKTQQETKEVNKFYEWLKRAGNVYMSDVERMDRAILIITENV